MYGEHQLEQVFSSVVTTSTEYDTLQTERGNTMMTEDGNAHKTTIENVTADFTQSGTTTFAESGATTLPKREISTSFTASLTETSSKSTDNGRPMSLALDGSAVTVRGITNATEWGTSGTTTWSSKESVSGSSSFVVSFTSDVPSTFHPRDPVTGWFPSLSSSSSPFNDTTAFNDTGDWDLYGIGSPAWGSGVPWFVNPLDGYPYPSLYGWDHIVVASIVVTAIMLLIVLGNVLVIVAVARDRNLSGIQNWFITSLALSDLFVGLFIMPLSLSYELMGYWTFGDVLCELWLSTDVLLCTASILNLVLISLDRYWSITRAVSYVRQRTKRRAVLMIGAVWVSSMIISLPPLVGWKRPQPTKFGYPLCVLSEEPGYVIYSTMGSFYLPLVVMVMVYLKIYLAARNRARRNLRKTPPPVEGNHCKSSIRSGTTTTTTTSTPIKMDPGEKYKGKLSPTREMSSGSPSPPPAPPLLRCRSSVAEEEPEEIEEEVEVAQVTIESVSPSTPSPVGGDPSTAITFSPDPSSPVSPVCDVASTGLNSSLVAAATAVHSQDVGSSVAPSSVVFSSVVHSPDVASSVVQSSNVAPSSVVASTVAHSTDVGSSVAPSSVVYSSVVDSPDVASSVVQSSNVASSVAPSSIAVSSSVVFPSAHASSVVQSSNVASSVVESSVADSSVFHASVAPSSVVHSSVAHSSDVASSVAPSSVVFSSVFHSPDVASSVVESSVAGSSVAHSPDVVSSVVHSYNVTSSVVHSSDVSPSSVVLSVVHSPDIASYSLPPSVSPSIAVPSSTRVRPQRIPQSRRSPTSLGTTVNASIPPNSSPSFATSAPATVEPSPSERRRSAMSNRRSYVASLTRRRSNPRCNGVKDVEKMKRKMARSRERRATVVLGIVMASFIGCWLPFFSLYPITLLVGLQLPDKLFAVIFWLGYCNSALNPIIYTIFNRDFRLAFQRILFSRRTKRF